MKMFSAVRHGNIQFRRELGSSHEPEQDAWRHEVNGIIQKSEDTALATSRISKIHGEFLIIQDVDCVE